MEAHNLLSSKNLAPLKYWQFRKYTSKDVDIVCKELDESVLFVRFDFLANGNTKATLSKKAWDTKQGHYPTLLNFIDYLVLECGGHELQGSIIIWLEDGMWEHDGQPSLRVPTMAFSRQISDCHTFLIPDAAYMHDTGYAPELSEIYDISRNIKWSDRQPTLFWRGACSGVSTFDENNYFSTP